MLKENYNKKIFILIPSLDSSSPIKGAICLANGLSRFFKVSLVILKRIKKIEQNIDPGINIISMESVNGILGKKNFYRAILKKNSKEEKTISISIGFSADLMNFMLRKEAIIISSIRSNLIGNYSTKFGFPGYLIALFHFFIIKFFDQTLSLSEEMTQQLKQFGAKKVTTVGNFVNEPYLEKFKKEKLYTGTKVNFLFLGMLVKRKKTELLIRVLKQIKNEGFSFQLRIIGNGPQFKRIKKIVKKLQMSNDVQLLGYIDMPYDLIQDSDYLILPSISEGISRAALEALYFGVPCIHRNIEGSNELIQENANGYLFEKDSDLAFLLKKISINFVPHVRKSNNSLIPEFFKYDECIKRYVDLLESI